MNTPLKTKQGFVSLVGAGPGDPDLITVKGLKRLKEAEVVAYDYLANSALLLECSSKTELIFVGKHKTSWKQEDINNLLISKAQQGSKVVRLKGGDPFIFGRGGEEALALQAAGISFEIVPGISSAFAVPAYAGIPLTHRQTSTSFTVVTGHEDHEKLSSTLNWSVLAQSETLVVLMGLGKLEQITLKLLEQGCSPKTPAAIVQWGTLPKQQTVIATLADIFQKAKQVKITPPATLIIGNVVAMQKELKWFS